MKALFGEKYKYSAALTHDLFTIVDGNMKYYGGSQNLYDNQKEKSAGCGIAGAADVVMYMKARDTGVYTFRKEEFLSISNTIRKYIPIIPGRGVNSFILAFGLNRLFKKNRIRYHAHWKCSKRDKWKITENMLKNDIPVILAIGNNYPFFWRGKGVNLYVQDLSQNVEGELCLRKERVVGGHFVVATAINGNVLTVSSWGRKYYINLEEYDRYASKISNQFYSNILGVRPL